MSDATRWLIVNADDLGRTSGINAGIFEAHDRGVVTSATLMVGFAAAAEAARGLAERPALGVGLHVTLTGAAPTLAPERVPSLVVEGGRFPAKPEGIAFPRHEELVAEIRNQLTLFRELTGRLPTHLDSHHHSHRHPTVREALLEVAAEHRLPVRASSPEIRARARDEGLATTDRFVERFFDAEATLEVLLEILDSVEAGTTELMCHPGRADDELRAGSTYHAPREREIAVLCDPAVRARIAARGLELGRFDQACGS